MRFGPGPVHIHVRAVLAPGAAGPVAHGHDLGRGSGAGPVPDHHGRRRGHRPRGRDVLLTAALRGRFVMPDRTAAIAGVYEHPDRRVDGLSKLQIKANAAAHALADAGLSW